MGIKKSYGQKLPIALVIGALAGRSSSNGPSFLSRPVQASRTLYRMEPFPEAIEIWPLSEAHSKP